MITKAYEHRCCSVSMFLKNLSLTCLGTIAMVCVPLNLFGQDPNPIPPKDTPKDIPAVKTPIADHEVTTKKETTSEKNARDLSTLLNKVKQFGDTDLEMLSETKQSPEQVEETEKHRKAIALYMTGRNHEHASKFKQAYQAYHEALALDPNSLQLYRSIIPLALKLRKTEEAIGYAKKAVEIDPDNFELLSQLGIYALRTQDIAGSIRYFEKAIKSKKVNKKSGTYVTIISQLGQLYLATGQAKKASQMFLVVYHAITKPNDFSLDFRTQRALETFQGNKAKTLEMLGELFLLTEKLEQAIDCFERASKATRKNPVAFSYQTARIFNKQKKYDLAMKKLQEYFDEKLTTKGKAPYLLYVELLIATDKKDDIITSLEKLSASDPTNEELKLYLASQYLDKSKIEKAKKTFLGLITGAKKGEVYLGLLKIYRIEKNAAKALDALASAMNYGASTERLVAERELLVQEKTLTKKIIAVGEKETTKISDTRKRFSQFYQLTKLAMLQKDYVKTKAFHTQAVKLKLRDRTTLKKLYDEVVAYYNKEKQYTLSIKSLKAAIASRYLSPFRLELEQELIRAYTHNKQVKEAISLAKAGQSKKPTDLEWFYLEGWVYYAGKDWEKAINIFGPLLERAKKEQNGQKIRVIRYDLSRCLTFVGMADKAIELLNQTIKEEPDDVLWKFQKGWVYYYSKQWPEAVTVYQAIVDAAGDNPSSPLIRQTNFSLSAALVQNKQFREGEIILEKYYEADPEDTSTCNDLGYLYADQNKKLEQAEKMIRKALDSEPENNAYLDSMGWVKYRLGKFEEAKKLLLKAVEGSEEGDAVLWDHMGDCHHKLKETDEAVAAWKKAIQHESASKYPDKELIKKIEAKLK